MDYRFDPDSTPDFTDLLDGTKVLEFVLGYDLDLDTIIYMQIILVRAESYLHSHYHDVYDLQFGIRERLAKNPHTLSCLDYSIISSRRFVPNTHRWWVSSIVLAGIEWLLKTVRPEYLTMETYHPNLPTKAMEKYHRIAEVINAVGYETRQSYLGTNGIHYWFFARNPPTRELEPLLYSLSRRYRRVIYLLWESVR